MDDTSHGRKRRSRFSDAPGDEDQRPTKLSSADRDRASVAASASSRTKPALDPAALAKAAAAKIAQATAAKIAQAIPKAAAPVVAAPHPIPADMEEQRRRADAIAKSVQEQMSHLKTMLNKPGSANGSATATGTASGTTIATAAAAAAAAAAALAAATASFKPAPLLLDEQGRQIDEHGNVVAAKVPAPVATLRANKTAQKTNQNPYLSHRSVDKDDKLDAVDPRLKLKKRETRAAKSFSFVQQGTYVKQADQLRARDAKKMLAGFTSGRNPRAYQKESIVPIDETVDGIANGSDGSAPTESTESTEPMELFDVDVPGKPESNPPDVEWWDIEFLPKEKKLLIDKFGFIKAHARKENPDVSVEYTEMKAKYCGTIHVIEHPARVSPMFKEETEPVALPLMLTAAERKKIRRQSRAEREKEKQDKVALGLMPPPEPKVKLSNMMKVLGEQAVADPSAIERKVRQQMAQREKNHEMRNLARKLTPEERREKKLRKIKEDAEGDIHVAVFRVPDLSNPQHRFKVDVNAQQYHLTGGVLLCKEDDINLIVVEGGRKAVKHYARLLMKRIRWNGDNDDDDSDGDQHDHSNGDDDAEGSSAATGSRLVWQGVVARRAFNNFRFQECRTKGTARKVMEAKNVVHYWDLVEKST